MRLSPVVGKIAVLLVMALTVGPLFAVPPSASAKKELLTMVERLEKETKDPLARYDTLKAANQLEEIGNRRHCVDLGGQLRQPMLNAIDAYDEAITGGGGHDPWPASDPDIAKARQTIDTMRARLAAAGMFTVRMPGEPPTTLRDRLDVIHDDAWNAALDAKHGKVDDARQTFAQLDSRIEGAKKEAGSTDHPGFKRFLAAYEKHKTDAAAFFATSDAARGTVDQDVASLTATYEQLQNWFQQVENRSGGGGTEESILSSLSELATMTEAFEKNDLPRLTKQMEAFAGTYGKTGDEIDQKIRELKGNDNFNPPPGMVFSRLGEIITKTREVRVERASYLLNDAIQALDNVGTFAESYQLQRMQIGKTKLQLAAQLDPANAQVKERLAGADALIASRAAFIEKEIDSRLWGGHEASFQGPGSVDALAAEGAKYLKTVGWEENPAKELLAIRIVGPWRDGDKNALGEVINYQLPCEAAFRMKADKEAGKDLARVFFIALYTQDKAYQPPFSKTGIGDSHFMRASKVSTGGAGSGSPSGWGVFAVLFWLALALVNIAAGLLNAGSFLTGKLPPIAAATKALTPLKAQIGLGGMVLGVLAFLRSLILCFDPLADLLPQAVVFLAGLLLARERMTAVAAAMTAAQANTSVFTPTPVDPAASAVPTPSKPAITPEIAVGKLAALEPLAIPLGLAGIVLGVLHLFLGGYPLI